MARRSSQSVFVSERASMSLPARPAVTVRKEDALAIDRQRREDRQGKPLHIRWAGNHEHPIGVRAFVNIAEERAVSGDRREVESGDRRAQNTKIADAVEVFDGLR